MPNKKKTTVARNIVNRRAKLGLSAMELAELADIPYPTLRDIESGIVSNARVQTIEKIAKALKCTPEDLSSAERISFVPLADVFIYLSNLDEKIEKKLDQLASEIAKISHAPIDEFSNVPDDIKKALKLASPGDITTWKVIRMALKLPYKKIPSAEEA